MGSRAVASGVLGASVMPLLCHFEALRSRDGQCKALGDT
jgi:hypothetical protein